MYGNDMKTNPPVETAQSSDKFTFEYFCTEVIQLRDMWGKQDFWDKPRALREKATDALAFVFVNLMPKDHEENMKGATLFQSTMAEYQRREFYLVMAGKTSMD